MKLETALATAIMLISAAVFVFAASNAIGPKEARAARPAAGSQPAQGAVGPVATRAPLSITPSTDQPEEIRGRDARRLSDLQALSAGLQEYRKQKGSYPLTGGNIQTACAFDKLDKLCDLKASVGADHLVDPRGNPTTYGYWYSSDGKTFFLYASMEGGTNGSDTCPQQASIIKAGSVFCLGSGVALTP